MRCIQKAFIIVGTVLLFIVLCLFVVWVCQDNAPIETEEEFDSHYMDVPLSKELQDYIYNTCQAYGVPQKLVVAVIRVESNFRADAVSGTSDYGLMQINKINHEWLRNELGVTDFLDPQQNVLCGVYILSSHLKATEGDIPLALMRYNCGATGAKRLWEQGVYETAYSRKVMSAYNEYCQEERNQ